MFNRREALLGVLLAPLVKPLAGMLPEESIASQKRKIQGAMKTLIDYQYRTLYTDVRISKLRTIEPHMPRMTQPKPTVCIWKQEEVMPR